MKKFRPSESTEEYMTIKLETNPIENTETSLLP